MQTTETNPAAANDFADERQDNASATSANKISELESALLALRDEQLRERADLDNQRKRLVRDVEQARKFANERLLGDLLPVMDALERGLELGGNDPAALREGMELTLRQLHKIVSDNGLGIVDPTGQSFNPEHHQAMSLVDSDEHGADTVVQTLQKGYLLNGRLLRPALVMVAK